MSESMGGIISECPGDFIGISTDGGHKAELTFEHGECPFIVCKAGMG
jgi:hypothetical protein